VRETCANLCTAGLRVCGRVLAALFGSRSPWWTVLCQIDSLWWPSFIITKSPHWLNPLGLVIMVLHDGCPFLVGRVIAQVVSGRILAAEAPVHAQVSQCGICGGRSGTGTVFFPSTLVFLCQYRCFIFTRISSERTDTVWFHRNTVSSHHSSVPFSRGPGSHGGEYEDGCLLGCSAVQSRRNLLTFQRYLATDGTYVVSRKEHACGTVEKLGVYCSFVHFSNSCFF
jgi:hypothetical protein